MLVFGIMFEGKEFRYDALKDDLLKQQRGLGFEEVIDLITKGYGLAVRDHHNMRDYHHQKIIEIDVRGYVYCIPCVVSEDTVFLKTIFPSRKATQVYKQEPRNQES